MCTEILVVLWDFLAMNCVETISNFLTCIVLLEIVSLDIGL